MLVVWGHVTGEVTPDLTVSFSFLSSFYLMSRRRVTPPPPLLRGSQAVILHTPTPLILLGSQAVILHAPPPQISRLLSSIRSTPLSCNVTLQLNGV